MIHPIRRTRQFVHNHPVVTHSAVASVALVAGIRLSSNAWVDFLLEESGPEIVEKFYAVSE